MNIFVATFVVLISAKALQASILDPTVENVVHKKLIKPPSNVPGMWKKKTIWKPRWIKEWKSAKVVKPIWRKIWSPVLIKEWVPIPKPPPGWKSSSTALLPLTSADPGKDNTPLWDPIPYPESQQPPQPPIFPPLLPLEPTKFPPLLSKPTFPPLLKSPPLPFPQPTPTSRPFFYPDTNCNGKECEEPILQTFTREQISGILSENKPFRDFTGKHGSQYSESVIHQTRISPTADFGGQKAKRLSSWVKNDKKFSDLPGLSQFLVPPKYQSSNIANLHSQLKDTKPNHQTFKPLNEKINFPESNIDQIRNHDLRQWTPLKAQNKINSLNTQNNGISQPVKFSNSNPRGYVNEKLKENFGTNTFKNKAQQLNGFQNNFNQNVKSDSNFIQPAELVSEYHYSEFDSIQNRKTADSRGLDEIDLFSTPSSTFPKKNQREAELKQREKNFNWELSSQADAKTRQIRKDVGSTVNNYNGQQPIEYLTNPLNSKTDLSNIVGDGKAKLLSNQFQVDHRFSPQVNNNPMWNESLKVDNANSKLQAIRNLFPETNRILPQPIYRPVDNITLNTCDNVNATRNNTKIIRTNSNPERIESVQLHFVYPKQEKNSQSNLETIILNALQQNFGDFNHTDNSLQFPVTNPPPISSTTVPSNSKSNIIPSDEIVTKHPVFIVTPTHKNNSNESLN